ncbi:hypothetical protein LINPERPRIM_LOCUS29140 [Linum perenne]
MIKHMHIFFPLNSYHISENLNSMGIEEAIAVAAAALAISVLEEEEEQASHPQPETTLQEAAPHQSFATRTKSQNQGMQGSQSGSVSIRYVEVPETESNGDDEPTPGKVLVPISSMTRTSTIADKPAGPKTPPSFINEKPVSSMKKIPSFVDKLPTSTKGEVSPLKRSAAKSKTSAADAWEKVQLEKLKGKYKQENDQIVSWEDGKKAKARRRLDRAESEMERNRMRALERFRGEMETVSEIAGGAKAKTAERMKKEEAKVKEKADAMRRSGKFPARRPCLCI